MRYLTRCPRKAALFPWVNTKGVSMRFRIALGAVLVVALSAVVATGVASAAPGGSNYTCSGGNWTGDPATSTFTIIPSGNYGSITVTGVCQPAPGAVINVSGSINVAPGAVFDAQSFSSTITVGHNVTAGAGSVLGLGCQPSNTIGMFAGVPCNDNPNQTVITVNGNISASDADTVLIRKVTVNGNVSLSGGGGDIPWSIKGNTIGRNLTISDVSADWLGVQFNTISNNAVLTNITALDPGDPGRTVAVVENTVGNILNCTGLAPGVSSGFFPGETNHVGHKALGQCAAISTPL
jgi:hypothetical protein